MIDFLMVSTRNGKNGLVEIYPKFIIPTKKKSSDLMIRGGDFYAIWNEELGLWSTDESDALELIDAELDKYAEENRDRFGSNVKVLHMWDSESGMIDRWHKYCQKQMRDSYHQLDEKLIFSNMTTTKKDYASKSLSYPLEHGNITAYNELMSVLYSPEERKKLEWAIGSIVEGDSKKIQKFLVLYGAAGTGKSTVLNIIEQLFDGYYATFDAKSLGSSNNAFALEAFRGNPLVAIQHDGDLSRIEDNTRLNSLVSHELMTVNEKFKSAYSSRFNCFLFMGTNKPVKITDAKSGLIRRLIDVTPTGKKIPVREYRKLFKQVSFELGAIAAHCRDVYLESPDMYDNYIPINMLGASNDFFNYVLDNYYFFSKESKVTLRLAWERYQTYCNEAKVPYVLQKRIFKEELKNYFWEFHETGRNDDGGRIGCYYSGFRKEKFRDNKEGDDSIEKTETNTIIFDSSDSAFDKLCGVCPAQYATKSETPAKKWKDVSTTLSDLDTSKLHYVKLPINHIVIDFDIKDEDGNKSLEKNIEAASKWPPTYAELSKSGKGIHLHYIYTGNPETVSRVYDENIEIKIFNGDSSLRRRLTKCNKLPIARISSGLPQKGVKVLNTERVKSEKGLRSLIKRNLNKEIHPGTKPSIDFIFKILEDAYESDLVYDVSDMMPALISFAVGSSNHPDYCMKMVNKMHLKSKEDPENTENYNLPIIFYDVEVFPNLFLINWKPEGENRPVVRMINPTPSEVEQLVENGRLVGFNCRRYDNHILYAAIMGYSNEQLYSLSQKIINEGKGFFGEAYNLSYTDVYDFSSKKQSLKKFEIELGIHHQELGLPWDQPVPEEKWVEVAEYCDNDVLATEAVFHARKADLIAREILSDLADMTMNDTTNSLTTRIIFEGNRKPQDQFNYRDMGNTEDDIVLDVPREAIDLDCDTNYTVFDVKGRPVFPGYIYEKGKSTYRDEVVGEGGYVYAEPGMYSNVALLDIASMHPSSIVAENLFGDLYTKRFKDILDARLAIKHKEFDKAKKMLGGKLAKYLSDEDSAADLAQALKIAINSVYGLTAATFDNPFRDVRNKDNIVAKRGALFMVNLKHEVQRRGFVVAHIKTDSIKIPNATKEIIDFVIKYGKMYGYNFEHEATYDRMCLVNDAVYIAKYEGGDWTATGTQFQVPYVFKTLFSKEKIVFDDLCETKQVSKGTLYLDMNENLPDVSAQEKELSKAKDKFAKGKMSDTSYDDIKKELEPQIAAGHNYIFVGRIGRFCPVKSGSGGGVLYRVQDDKHYAASGTTGYRWLESEVVKRLKKEDDIDHSYYISLVDDAVDTMSKFGDVERFLHDENYYISSEPKPGFMNPPETVELPFV